RAGSPLIEIVTEPDLRSPEEAKAFVTELRAIMRTIDVSDADMEKGHLRCDANVSLQRVQDDGEAIDKSLNPKVEIKNLNSFRSVERALAYEIERQTKLYRANTIPTQNETRGWDEKRGATEVQRSKESAHDYRYFPEPDLPALDLAVIRDKVALPELPAAKRARLTEEYGLAPADARTLVEDPAAADWFEEVLSELRAWLEALPENEDSREEIWEENRGRLAKLAAGWFLSKLWGLMTEHHVVMKNLKIDPENFAEFITLVSTNKVNSTSAQTILADMLLLGKDPSQVMEDRRLGQIEDTDTLAPVVERIVRENPKLVADYKAGKTQVLQSLIGMVMKATEGRAHPKVTSELLKLHLEH
ncbi:Asp-tRNA(Asn)/Glu-tRNA(Gln) amidotransferase subunit GatB, partial [Patescibacteria group bacterium]